MRMLAQRALVDFPGLHQTLVCKTAQYPPAPCSYSQPFRRTLCSGGRERLLGLSGGLEEAQSLLWDLPVWVEAAGPVPHQREDGTGMGGEDPGDTGSRRPKSELPGIAALGPADAPTMTREQ